MTGTSPTLIRRTTCDGTTARTPNGSTRRDSALTINAMAVAASISRRSERRPRCGSASATGRTMSTATIGNSSGAKNMRNRQITAKLRHIMVTEASRWPRRKARWARTRTTMFPTTSTAISGKNGSG